ncbi:fructokinase [Arthrobacter silviterrae]|uniref:Carbohydrate kinase n=1 Tax=Arthrobacter silviterrae TaxID=2026658 RepID=A0ABX0DDU5_9MICC|nr:carbohydrate kinase [Arthrobacter silviterrae]MDQ0276578.1 fructokinase [Arthrobacter silviterrae]NGN84803.1 carbohydrate kinase [Arthrobacter silviterrae]
MTYLNTTWQNTNRILDVIVIGEALTDVVVTSGGTSEHPGGSPANVAYGLGRLGVSTGLLTALGDDDRGAAIETHLRSTDVTLLPGAYSLDRTSSATATLTQDGSASYNFDVVWDLEPAAPAYVPKVLHTGSIATFLAPGAGAVKTLMQHCHHDCIVTYDPNIRPSLLGSHAEALSIFEDLINLTDVVKLSDEDATWLYPRMNLDDIAGRLLRLGAGLVVITQGAQGALLATPDTRLTIPAVQSTVVDTIGAGDSYMAALIMGLLTRVTVGYAPSVLEQVGRTASMAAAITVRRPGANPPTSDELRAHLEQPTA